MAVVHKRDDCIHEPVCAVCGALSCPAECGHYIKVEKFTSYNSARDEILQALARGYCAPINSGKELDSNLILAMADELAKLSPVA